MGQREWVWFVGRDGFVSRQEEAGVALATRVVLTDLRVFLRYAAVVGGQCIEYFAEEGVSAECALEVVRHYLVLECGITRSMRDHEMRLQDAGVREREFVRKLLVEGKMPPGVFWDDVLSHGVYDARADEVRLTVRGVDLSWRVEVP